MKIFCIGRNYVAHTEELGNNVPTEPMVFCKPPTAQLRNNDPFYYPDFSDDIHYEVELILKICKNGKSIKRPFAKTYYKEIGLGIDFTARDLQTKLKSKGHPWEIAKGFDKSALIGGFINKKELPEHINFSLMKNQKTVQKGDSTLMIFNFDDLIIHISKYFTLQKGDLIFTGTPAGVGPLKVGDRLQGYIQDKEMFNCLIM